jgi:hypothetical protein
MNHYLTTHEDDEDEDENETWDVILNAVDH